MQELLMTLLQAVLTVAVPIISTFAIRFLNAKSEQAKTSSECELSNRYRAEALEAAAKAVGCIEQTYVSVLKGSEQWTEKNQSEAFNKALATAKSLLTEEASKFLTSAYGDLSIFLQPHIESEVGKLHC